MELLSADCSCSLLLLLGLSLLPVCKEEVEPEQQEIQVKLEPLEIKEEQQENSISLVQVKVEPQCKEEQQEEQLLRPEEAAGSTLIFHRHAYGSRFVHRMEYTGRSLPNTSVCLSVCLSVYWRECL